MNLKNNVMKCHVCGLTIEVLSPCDCAPECNVICCGKPMETMAAKTADMSKEKHVPVPSSLPEGGTKVVVGSTPHPMTAEHYVEWIEIINGDYVNRKYLKPGEAAEALFHVKLQKGMVVREFCNIHGLWTYTVQ